MGSTFVDILNPSGNGWLILSPKLRWLYIPMTLPRP
jgi:hypothetical protein